MRTKPEYFYLNNGENRIHSNDITELASLALTLKPLPDITEEAGYAAALYEYMNKNSNHLLFDSFNLLYSDSVGKEMLDNYIKLFIIEKSFIMEGAKEDTIRAHNIISNKCSELLQYNRLTFEESASKMKR